MAWKSSKGKEKVTQENRETPPGGIIQDTAVETANLQSY